MCNGIYKNKPNLCKLYAKTVDFLSKCVKISKLLYNLRIYDRRRLPKTVFIIDKTVLRPDFRPIYIGRDDNIGEFNLRTRAQMSIHPTNDVSHWFTNPL